MPDRPLETYGPLQLEEFATRLIEAAHDEWTGPERRALRPPSGRT